MYRVACAGAWPAQPKQLKPLDGGGRSMSGRSMVRGRGGAADIAGWWHLAATVCVPSEGFNPGAASLTKDGIFAHTK